ncbi:MAG: glycosyltransferase [Gammaproteobacteria bacterium]
MGKDLLDDRFGRFRELPLGLARLGHEVRGIALSYRRKEEGTLVDSDPPSSAGVTWHSVNLTAGLLPLLERFVNRAIKLASEFEPDVIWAGSDAYHVIFGAWLAKRTRTRGAVDLYDNFEAFKASKVPFVLPRFRQAVREADGVTCFSKRLADRVVQTYPRQKPTAVIENGVRKEFFTPQDRNICRQRLGLPIDATVIGTAGALDTSRGIDTLFKAFDLLAIQNGNIHLALAGPRDRKMRIPTGPGVHDLGNLPHEDVPCFIKALDVSVVCYRQSAQGEYSFPQKAYEILACKTPLVSAAVGSMNELLIDYPQCLYEPENPASLADAIRRQLAARTVVDVNIPLWADSAKELEIFFEAVLQESSTIEATKSARRSFGGERGQPF